MSRPLLIVGTGRCGSTLVSQMLDDHPEVTSLSELFTFASDLGNRVPWIFPAEAIDGEAFWQRMAYHPPRLSLLLRHGLRMPEVTHDFDHGPRRLEDGAPALLLTTLPRLGGDPEATFAALAPVMRARGPAPVAAHYHALFEWLMTHHGHRTWAERSGGSLRLVHRLVAAFPEARVLHLVRDGRDTALSMSRHIGFRMALASFQLLELLGVDPWESADRREAGDLPDELAALLPECFTAEAFDRYDLAPSLCGHYWSGEIRRGLETLDALPPDRLVTLRYEDFLTDPTAAVERLGAALDLGPVPVAWRDRAAAMVRSGRSAWHALPARDRRELDAACAPGVAALAERGITWPA
ncbi:MAG: sulfotransferase [Myxococcales bacterium]|nr:sulfotransferase [Myxococcales bacterium]